MDGAEEDAGFEEGDAKRLVEGVGRGLVQLGLRPIERDVARRVMTDLNDLALEREEHDLACQTGGWRARPRAVATGWRRRDQRPRADSGAQIPPVLLKYA